MTSFPLILICAQSERHPAWLPLRPIIRPSSSSAHRLRAAHALRLLPPGPAQGWEEARRRVLCPEGWRPEEAPPGSREQQQPVAALGQPWDSPGPHRGCAHCSAREPGQPLNRTRSLDEPQRCCFHGVRGGGAGWSRPQGLRGNAGTFRSHPSPPYIHFHFPPKQLAEKCQSPSHRVTRALTSLPQATAASESLLKIQLHEEFR